MQNTRKSRFMASLALVGGLGLAIIILATTAVSAAEGRVSRWQVTETTPAPTATVTASPTASPSPTPTPVAAIYMPWMSVFKTPEVELLTALTSDQSGGKLQAFQPGETMIYKAGGVNNTGAPVPVGLRWELDGPCAAGTVYSNTLSIPPIWETAHYSTAPGCSGVFTATASLRYEALEQSLYTRYAVNPPGSIQVNVQHGFDKCYFPDLDDMETWWLKSPYVVYNLYLGGISFACDDQPLDAVWVHQAAQQGWQFILAWVGPQAPCSKFKHKFSEDPGEAYTEGREEASSAHAAAESLGFFGPKVIYYDLESYSGADAECRDAAKQFLKGWSEKLHDLGDKSGAYGAPCTSYISDWATVATPPDDVWIAHWYLDEYDPEATVWDTPCLSDSLWPDNQRLKQYAGGHDETWGGVRLRIDSNVLHGEVNLLPVGVAAASQPGLAQVVLQRESEPLRDLGLFSHSQGWVIAGERLLVSEDGGGSWQDITPELEGKPETRLLEVEFYDRLHGWAALATGGLDGLAVAHTRDGGQTWQVERLPGGNSPDETGVERAYFELLDQDSAYLALKLQTGSSFSLGRLMRLEAIHGGEINWEARDLPLGEPVIFEDELNGWTSGGADGKQAYFTTDGGRSWTEMQRFAHRQDVLQQDGLAGVSGLLQGGLPEGTLAADITAGGYAWAIVQDGACLGEKRPGQTVTCTQSWALLRSEDGGKTWEEIAVEPGPGG
jgi:hypothetical protein